MGGGDFFFSSRRRHTRLRRDWSSDVCSSDLVNASRMDMMPGTGFDGVNCGNHLVNCARGGIVNENDALAALESGQLSSVALDVFEIEPAGDNSLLQHPNFHGTPHIGAATA